MYKLKPIPVLKGTWAVPKIMLLAFVLLKGGPSDLGPKIKKKENTKKSSNTPKAF